MAVKHTFKYLRSVYPNVEERVETKELTRGEAIRYHCLDCSGGLPKDVRECELDLCPLWPFRPYQNS